MDSALDNEEIYLDDEQRAAVEYNGKKPLVVDAGPGSGKTRVIIERVVYLINELNQNPSSILVITFTNKAADELKARLKMHPKLTMGQINQMRVSTIHSFCRYLISTFEEYPYNLLKRNGERGLFLQKHREELGFVNESFLRNNEINHAYNKYSDYITFNVDVDELVSYIEETQPVSDEFIEYIREFYRTHESWQYPSAKEIKELGFKDDLYNARYLKIAQSYPEYLKLLEREKVCDQDYLLVKACEILSNENNLKAVQYKNVLIDEFQDTDPNQMKIFEKLLNNYNTFTVVGDVDQSIYSFRGAYPEFFIRWSSNEDDFKRVVLKNNYRSSKDIVEFNEVLISSQRKNEKELISKNDYKMPVYNLYNEDIYIQAKNIVKIIEHMKETGKIEKYSDIGILFRARNKKIFTILEELDDKKIPYHLKGIEDLIYQDEVKAILALFWYLLPHDNLYLRPYEDEWLSLNAFTDVYYNSSKIFKLSFETMEILRRLEANYREDVKDKEKRVWYDNRGRRSQMKSYKGIFNRSDDILKEIFDDLPRIDLSKLNCDELIKLGITNKHDLNFFEKLNEIKNLMDDEDINFYDKPTTLQLFYKLINISGFHDDILSRNDRESLKASLNLSLISQIISDYESIMGKWNINGLFNYLSGILKKYSCPINDIEDNSDKVHIMTIHKAKGLEYPVVILGSLEEGSFPRKFSEKRETGRYIYGRANYYTPNYCYEFKPDSIEEEASNHDEEETRVIYVATTRAEELLILSNLEKKDKPMPGIIADITREYPKLRKLDMNNLSVLKKVRPRKVSEDPFSQISYDNISKDYMSCPKKYHLLNDLSYRNPENNSKFIEDLLHIILSTIHIRSQQVEITDEIIEDIMHTVLNSFSISSENIRDEVMAAMGNITNYWNDFGKDYVMLAHNLRVSMILNNVELYGNVDLVIKDDSNKVSVVNFITSKDVFLEGYAKSFTFYGSLVKNHDDFKEYDVNKLIFHSISDNEQFILDFDKKTEKEVLEFLNDITKDVCEGDFVKNNDKCENCEFKDMLCKT